MSGGSLACTLDDAPQCTTFVDVTATPLELLCMHRGVMMPSDGQLLDLASVLDMRPADLLAIAGGEIPVGFMPAAADAGDQIATIASYSFGTDPRVLEYARSLPVTPRPTSTVGLPALETVTFGGAFRRLMKIRNLTRKGMAYATWLAQSTVNITMADYRLPMPDSLRRMAATLCLRADDFEAMAARSIDEPPPPLPRPESSANDLPRLWAQGELILALTPLHAEQIDAVIAFGKGLPGA
jgi:hypothetical protein